MKIKKKVGLYSPYLHILGGGERYFISIAQILNREYDVSVFAARGLKKKIKKILDIPLDNINIISIDNFYQSAFKKYFSLLKFQLFFYMTDGSIFFPSAKKNFLMIQSPIHIPKLTLINRLKLNRWQPICYSNFMKKIIEKELGKNVKILSPYVDDRFFINDMSKKENIILTVGRFFSYPHTKKHDLLVKHFKTNFHHGFRNWKLVIAGGLTEKSGEEILANLRKISRDFPIEIYVNLPFNQLLSLFRRAKIYWHATGFQENTEKYPEKAEHFGITTLEAMAAGLVPIAYNSGGQRDIIEDGVSGYLWNSAEELINKTFLVIKNPNLLIQLSNRAMLRARDFSYEQFNQNLQKIIF